MSAQERWALNLERIESAEGRTRTSSALRARFLQSALLHLLEEDLYGGLRVLLKEVNEGIVVRTPGIVLDRNRL